MLYSGMEDGINILSSCLLATFVWITIEALEWDRMSTSIWHLLYSEWSVQNLALGARRQVATPIMH